MNGAFLDPYEFISDAPRHPNSVIVRGTMTPVAMRLARAAYLAFADRAQSSVITHHDERFTLADGSRMRVLRHGADEYVTIDVKNAADEEDGGIPHGFVVLTPWSTPAIYKRKHPEGTWSWDALVVPQASEGIVQDNQAIVDMDVVNDETGDTEVKPVPMPLVPTSGDFWDWAPHSAPKTSNQKSDLPINLKYGARHELHPSHAILGGSVVDESGTEIMSIDRPLDGSGVPYGDFLPHATDYKGRALAVNIYYKHLVSALFDIYEVSTTALHLKRTGPLSYAEQGRVTQVFNPGFNPGPRVLVDEVRKTLGRDVGSAAWIKRIVNDDFRSPPGAPGIYTKELGGTYLFTLVTAYEYGGNVKTGRGFFNLHEKAYDLEIAQGENAHVIEMRQNKSGGLTRDDILSLPSFPATKAALELKTDRPVDFLWEAGNVESSLVNPPNNSQWRYGVLSKWLYVRGIERTTQATPQSAALDIGWAKPKICEGSARAEMKGRHEWSDEHRYNYGLEFVNDNADMYFTSAAFPGDGTKGDYGFWQTVPYGWTGQLYQDAFYTAQSNDLQPYIRQLHEDYSGTVRVELVDDAIYNDLDYDYKTRYIIDHDQKARFYACIAVRVKSTGLHYAQDPHPDAVRGRLKMTNKPSYEVTISFEWRWGTDEGSTTLGTASFTRDPFEYPMVRYSNVFTWPAADPLMDINCNIPPPFGVTHRLMDQLPNLTHHQGVTPHLAAKDAEVEDMDSAEGIEFSYVVNGEEIPHQKVATGMLYARSFKLTDFQGAIELLGAMKIDCRYEDREAFTPEQDALWPRWYYCPELREVVEETVHHIELRDGKLQYWSDSLSPKTDDDGKAVPKPPRPERGITLRRV